MSRPKGIWFAAPLLLLAGTGLYLAWRRGPVGASPVPPELPGEREPAGTVLGGPSPRGPALSAAAPAVEAMIRDYVRLGLLLAPARDLDQSEHGIELALQEVSPSRRLSLFLEASAPSARAVILRSVDDGLIHDRASEEAAIEAALERAGNDLGRASEIARLAQSRVLDRPRRDRMAGKLAGPGMPEGLLPWAARLATGEPRIRTLREAFWGRVPSPGAVEALGWVIAPDEATRLESLGGGPAVREALERAYQRTGDPAFQESLRRIGP